MTPINETLQSARSLGDWGFVLAIIFVAAIVLSTVAEKLSGQQRSKLLWNTLKTTAGVLLIGALAMEYSGHKRETRILDSDKAELRSTNALLISSNLAMAVRLELLRKTNNELEEARLPMDAGTSEDFRVSLKDVPPTPVFITRRPGDDKAKQTVERLIYNFHASGWPLHGTYETNEYGPGIVLRVNPGQSEKALHVLRKAFLDRNIPTTLMLADNRTLRPTNAIYIFVGERPHPSIADPMVLGGLKREALWFFDAYVKDHAQMTSNELADANNLGEEVLKGYVERIREVANDPKRGGGTNGISRINLSSGPPFWSVTVSNGIPVEYVSGSNTIPFTPGAISNWNKLVEGTLEPNSN
jgi:hypothetical protein